MDAVEAVARALWRRDDKWSRYQWEHLASVIKDMFRGDAQAALSAARPFIAAECAKGEFSAGQAVIYTPFGEEGFHANFEGYVEGWPNLRFKDGSTCIVRPSRVIATSIKETIR